ncbi:MAG: hypothetical protein HPY66_3495 [Firmicutes bacterium]|nr:hypothetical protein [Bacillota bacterium]MDI6706038.1 hypothetical protein [Bacillota bacterium]
MEYCEFKQQLMELLQDDYSGGEIAEEMYFFIMGQFLVFALVKAGGLDRRMRELNYITNPYLPIGIKEVERRTMRFLKRFKEAGGCAGHRENFIYRILEKYRYINGEGIKNQRTCEEAFYLGLHSENIIADTGKL